LNYVVLANNPTALGGFAYHPPLGAIAFSAMAYGESLQHNVLSLSYTLAQGISVLQPARKPDVVEKALSLHGLLVGFIAVPLILISGTIMYQRKENNGQPHYTSWHGVR